MYGFRTSSHLQIAREIDTADGLGMAVSQSGTPSWTGATRPADMALVLDWSVQSQRHLDCAQSAASWMHATLTATPRHQAKNDARTTFRWASKAPASTPASAASSLPLHPLDHHHTRAARVSPSERAIESKRDHRQNTESHHAAPPDPSPNDRQPPSSHPRPPRPSLAESILGASEGSDYCRSYRLFSASSGR